MRVYEHHGLDRPTVTAGPRPTTNRRRFLELLGMAGAATALPASLAACDQQRSGASRTLKVGFVAPRTGTQGSFSEANDFVLANLQDTFGSGIEAGGSRYAIEVVTVDTQSDIGRAKDVTAALIDEHQPSIVVSAASADTIGPVTEVCEQREVPCLTTISPLDQWYVPFRRSGTEPEWSYSFYWSQRALYGVFLAMWDSLASNKRVGALWADDTGGSAWRDRRTGFVPAMREAGYRFFDPGAYANGSGSFTPIVEDLEQAEAELVVGAMQPADFATWWKQANDVGYRPLAVSMARANQSPAFMEAMSPSGVGLSIGAAWTPAFPYQSSLTGAPASALAEEYTTFTQRQWVQSLAYIHALFEVTVDVLRRSDDPNSPLAVRSALDETKLTTVVGPVDFASGPFPHSAATPLVGAQWREAQQWPFELVIVQSSHDDIPAGDSLEPLR